MIDCFHRQVDVGLRPDNSDCFKSQDQGPVIQALPFQGTQLFLVQVKLTEEESSEQMEYYFTAYITQQWVEMIQRNARCCVCNDVGCVADKATMRCYSVLRIICNVMQVIHHAMTDWAFSCFSVWAMSWIGKRSVVTYPSYEMLPLTDQPSQVWDGAQEHVTLTWKSKLVDGVVPWYDMQADVPRCESCDCLACGHKQCAAVETASMTLTVLGDQRQSWVLDHPVWMDMLKPIAWKSVPPMCRRWVVYGGWDVLRAFHHHQGEGWKPTVG